MRRGQYLFMIPDSGWVTIVQVPLRRGALSDDWEASWHSPHIPGEGMHELGEFVGTREQCIDWAFERTPKVMVMFEDVGKFLDIDRTGQPA